MLPALGNVIFCNLDLTPSQMNWLKAILVFGIVFYLLLAFFGVKNIYQYLWLQKRYKRVTLCAIYVLSELQCLLRIAQNALFLHSDKVALQIEVCALEMRQLETAMP